MANKTRVNFDTYIGKEFGEDPGAEQALRNYSLGRTKIKNLIKENYKKQYTKKELEDARDYLKGVYFGNAIKDDNNTFYEDYRKMIANTVNKKFNLNKSLFTMAGDELQRYYIDKKEKAKKTDEKVSRRKRKETSTFRVMMDRMALINKIKKNIVDNPNFDKKKKEEIEDAYKNSEILLKDLNTYLNSLSEKERQLLKRSGTMIFSKITNLSKKQYEEQFQNFENNLYPKMIDLIESSSDTDLIGEVGELGTAIALMGIDFFKNNNQNTVLKTLKDLDVRTGQQYTGKKGGRGGVTLEISQFGLDDNDLTKLANEFSDKYKKEKDVIIRTPIRKFNGVELTSRFSSDSSVQIKMDIQVPSESKHLKNSRISVKNWKDIFNENFGDTSIIYALERSLGNKNIIDSYLFNLQHPQQGRDIREESLTEAHNLAKISLLADIVLGASQKATSADILEIIDRKNKDVLLFDLKKEIYRLVNSKGYAKVDLGDLSSFCHFKIQGYDDMKIEDYAREVRERVMKTTWKNTSNSYRYLMYNYCNSISPSVKLAKLTK